MGNKLKIAIVDNHFTAGLDGFVRFELPEPAPVVIGFLEGDAKNFRQIVETIKDENISHLLVHSTDDSALALWENATSLDATKVGGFTSGGGGGQRVIGNIRHDPNFTPFVGLFKSVPWGESKLKPDCSIEGLIDFLLNFKFTELERETRAYILAIGVILSKDECAEIREDLERGFSDALNELDKAEAKKMKEERCATHEQAVVFHKMMQEKWVHRGE